MSSFRIDRFLTLYFFHPLIREKELVGGRKIPILMYHSIANDRESSTNPYYHTNTSPTVFAEHMGYLFENDYSVIDLQDVESCFGISNKSTRKCAIITFDDGYRDFFTDAFPILQKYRFPATVFLPTDFIGNEKSKLRGKDHLTWNQVSELSDGGISFGSHTVTHPELSGLSSKDVDYEIRQSKKTIEDKLGKRIDLFSYPFKFPDENKAFIKELRETLKKHKYRRGVSTRIGTTSKRDERYFMKRIPINSEDDISFFQAKLEGGYNWLLKPQHLYKIFKSRQWKKHSDESRNKGFGAI